MYKRTGIFALLMLVGVVAFAAFGDESARAQQTEPKSPVAVTPTPPIEEDDAVEKVETESVNVLLGIGNVLINQRVGGRA